MNSGRNQKENRARWLTLKVLLDANRYALQANKKVYIAILVFMLMNSLNIYISLSFTEYVINAATYIINRQISFYQAVQTVSVYTVILLLFLVLSVLTTNLKNRLYLDVNHIFQKQLNAKLSHIEWEYYESHMTFAQIFEVRQHANQAILELLDSSFVLLSFVPNSIVFVFYLLQINILVIPIYILLVLAFNLKLASPNSICPLKYPSCLTATCSNKLASFPVACKCVTFCPLASLKYAPNSIFLTLVLISSIA